MHGDGQQTRCFLHVSDAVRAILKLMACESAVGNVINIGGEEEVSIAELARQVIAQAGGGEVALVPYEEVYPGRGFEDLRRRVPSLDRARQLIDFSPEYSLSQIIADCLRSAAED